ncbi:putative quinol monooxygenase [Halomonas binhaiensis]
MVKQELPVHIELTRSEPGCLVFVVTPDKSHPNRFAVYEEFADREAFDTHQARVKNSRWGRVTSNAERHYEIIESTHV